MYVKQLGGKYHDEFYTNEKVKAAYKKYIATFINRYKVRSFKRLVVAAQTYTC